MTDSLSVSNIKAAFFDVDGTLVSNAQHVEPTSSREALQRLRAAGIICVLATGRAPYQLGEVAPEDFDAYITINGQLCYTPERVLYKSAVDRHDVSVVVDQVCAGLYPCIFFEQDQLYASDKSSRTLAMQELSGIDYPVHNPLRALDHDIYQFNALLHPGEENVLVSAVKNVQVTRWSELFCDVVPSNGGKQRGVHEIMQAFDLEPEECLAFGDGENDLGMFNVVGMSVAMGGSSDLVKRSATFVTDDVDHDGVLHACERLRLI